MTDRMDSKVNEVVHAVLKELTCASQEYPPFNSAHEGFAILKEEVDELWAAVMLKQRDVTRDGLMRKEAVQVAAMAIRFLIDVC